MEKKVVTYTNEKLSKKFKSNFELVSYAIKLAENMIKTGRDARVKSDVQNRAMLILEEISEGKDKFDEIEDHVPRPSPALAAMENELKQELLSEEKAEKRKYKTVETYDDEV
jgi:hypothetical protein